MVTLDFVHKENHNEDFETLIKFSPVPTIIMTIEKL